MKIIIFTSYKIVLNVTSKIFSVTKIKQKMSRSIKLIGSSIKANIIKMREM